MINLSNLTTLQVCQLLRRKRSFNAMEEDVICATPKTGCQHYCHENEKLAWLVENQLDEIMRIWTEDKERAKESEATLANELLEKLVSVKENAASLQRDNYAYLSKTREAVGHNGELFK